MDVPSILALTILIFAAALLYSSVGHAGASGYLAAMALFGLSPALMKPTALGLNILVAAIAGMKFYRAGRFCWSLFWPFAVTSVPFAFLGGRLALPGTVYKIIVGLMLLYAAYRLFRATQTNVELKLKPLSPSLALAAGMVIGLLSGLTGVGGGIFLSPLLIFMRWADVRLTSGVASVFILVNSIAGLLGHTSKIPSLPGFLFIWGAAAVVGGWIGSEYGSHRLQSLTMRRLLAAVLVIAGFKMIFT